MEKGQMTLNIANFPISGPRENPRAEDYALEAMLLRQEGRALWAMHNGTRSGQLYELARQFQRIARMKGWASSRLRIEQAA